MRKSRLSRQRIIAILKPAEVWISPDEVCRRHEISDATLYDWRETYGSMALRSHARTVCLRTPCHYGVIGRR